MYIPSHNKGVASEDIPKLGFIVFLDSTSSHTDSIIANEIHNFIPRIPLESLS